MPRVSLVVMGPGKRRATSTQTPVHRPAGSRTCPAVFAGGCSFVTVWLPEPLRGLSLLTHGTGLGAYVTLSWYCLDGEPPVAITSEQASPPQRPARPLRDSADGCGRGCARMAIVSRAVGPAVEARQEPIEQDTAWRVAGADDGDGAGHHPQGTEPLGGVAGRRGRPSRGPPTAPA